MQKMDIESKQGGDGFVNSGGKLPNRDESKIIRFVAPLVFDLNKPQNCPNMHEE